MHVQQTFGTTEWARSAGSVGEPAMPTAIGALARPAADDTARQALLGLFQTGRTPSCRSGQRLLALALTTSVTSTFLLGGLSAFHGI